MVMRVLSWVKGFVGGHWKLLLIVIAVLGFIAFRTFGPGAQSSTKEDTYTVKRHTLKETLSISGEIDASQKATLRFQTSGYLSWVGVKEGDTVNKYQVVASLDQEELKKTMQKDLNTYIKARNDFEQNREDNNYNFFTDELKRAAEDYQMTLNNSVLDVELQDLAVKYANLWTPIAGIITRVEVPNAGINITPAQAEIDVVNPDTLYFSATADQTDVGQITSSMSGIITLDAFEDETIPATVSAIGFVPKTGETGTVYEVKLPLPGEALAKLGVRLGMTGSVDFVTKEIPNALSVPVKYIKSENGKKYVMVKDGNGGKKVYVTTGQELDSDVEIMEGLKENDVVY